MVKFALGNLFSRKVRSALSVLGLTVAIAGMVGLFSIAGGIDQLVSSTFEMIPGLLVQQRGAPVPLFSTLPLAWKEELQQIEGVGVVNSEILIRANMIDGKTIISPPRFLLGLDIESRLKLEHGIYDDCLEEGRFLETADAGTRNCVISRSIADEFGRGVGDTLIANGHEVTIVGIYQCGSVLLDVSILMDIGTVRSISRFDPNSVSVYYIETTGHDGDDVIARRIEQHFADRDLAAWDPMDAGSLLLGGGGGGGGGAGGGDPLTQMFRSFDRALKGNPEEEQPAQAVGDDPLPGRTPETSVAGHAAASGRLHRPLRYADSPVEVRSADDWAESFDEFTGDLDLFLTLMTAIGVVIAVLSIVNTMLMSVSERRTEFGILRANGWSRGHVLRLVTFESGLLGVAGGLLGAGLGWGATLALNWYFPERLYLHAGGGLLAFSIVFSVLLGVAGGLYPAWMAARLSPMEAIRRG